MSLLHLAVVLFFTKGCGWVIKRFGQPSVLGEVLAGIIIGPSLLALVPPSESIKGLAELGVLLLMFIAGLETDVHELKSSGVASTLIAIGGVALPFAVGPLMATLFHFAGPEGIMLGAILTATSVSISVQTLLDLGQLKSRQGTTILGAAIIDDILGIIVLTLVVGITGEVHQSVWLMLLKMLFYFLLAALLGARFIGTYLKLAVRVRLKEALLTLTLALAMVFAYLAEISGVAAITGAYLLGVLISRTGFRGRITERVSTLGYGFFIPVFFASIGLDANLHTFDRSGLLFSFLFIVLAIVTKVVGCGLTSKLLGFAWRQSLQIGVGMIPRAEVALVIASLALRTGTISQAMFSTVVLLVVATTVITPPLLKLAFATEPKPDMKP